MVIRLLALPSFPNISGFVWKKHGTPKSGWSSFFSLSNISGMYLVESMKIVELITISIFQYPWNIPRFGNRLQAIWNIHKHFFNISWNIHQIFSIWNIHQIWFPYGSSNMIHEDISPIWFPWIFENIIQSSNIHQIFHQYSNIIHGTSGGFDGEIPGCRWAALRIVVGDVTQTQVVLNGLFFFFFRTGQRGQRAARIGWMLHRKDQENYDKHLNHVNVVVIRILEH